MRILITGASGLVGSALSAELATEGHSVGRFVRSGSSARKDVVAWNPATGEMDLRAVEGTDAIVNLAGASIGGSRWTEKRKALLRTSRVNLTEQLVRNLEKLTRRPSVLVSASAIGYYGDRGEEVLSESSPPGNEFLSQLSAEWETAAIGAEKLGIRTVITRFGIVLSKNGGALPQMLTPFKLGVGGRLGSGKQWMSWVALDDVVAAIRDAIETPSWRGPMNVVAPNPVRNVEFTRVLARVLHRPALFPAPAFALRLMLGEMADALLLSSQRVVPQKLLDGRFSFRYVELETALRHALET
ncbi:MAG: TIGR01777 family oxidoreductase [Candidatus Acidiferrales bacterium]